MTKKEVAKQLRKRLTEAIRQLPDVEYQNVSLFTDVTTQSERDRETRAGSCVPEGDGTLHIIEFNIEQEREAKGYYD